MTLKNRTAVLVVHGIGSQRAQETMRGVVRAAWFDDDDGQAGGKRLWTHPERISGADIDLAVMTTNEIPGSSDSRVADFHELYWAHLMSETKPIAVLLWLFELGRKGPHFKPGMNGLWWCGAIFLCFLNLSVALLSLQGIVWFSRLQAISYSLLVAPLLMVSIAAAFGLLVSLRYKAERVIHLLGTILLGLLGVAVFLFILALALKWMSQLSFFKSLMLFTNIFLPFGIALLATWLLMDKWGLRAFARACALSLIFFAVYLAAIALGWRPSNESLVDIFRNGWLPWSMESQWSSVAAWTIIALYLAVNASFLQPYLGDAARYFRNSPANVAVRREIRRQAVGMLDELHNWKDDGRPRYDRIIVVAHSLGAVVAYDMLRTYYSRICDDMPANPADLGQEFDEVDAGNLDMSSLRAKGRKIIAKMADVVTRRAGDPTNKVYSTLERRPKAWLVTDFVTLGSPLTHVYYLMCHGKTDRELEKDFRRRVKERDFPTCPPQLLDGDGWLSFRHHEKRQFHHGGVFALTRWTNLFFPLTQIFWGDAIGGPASGYFRGNRVDGAAKDESDCEKGLKGILDIELPLSGLRRDGFFTHTLYWDVTQEGGREAPHIRCLRQAVDLEDSGVANDAASFSAIPGVRVGQAD